MPGAVSSHCFWGIQESHNIKNCYIPFMQGKVTKQQQLLQLLQFLQLLQLCSCQSPAFACVKDGWTKREQKKSMVSSPNCLPCTWFFLVSKNYFKKTIWAKLPLNKRTNRWPPKNHKKVFKGHSKQNFFPSNLIFWCLEIFLFQSMFCIQPNTVLLY